MQSPLILSYAESTGIAENDLTENESLTMLVQRHPVFFW
jgi:hypothetical protein